MKRREFITLLGGAAAAWPLAARAQQSVMPVIGYLDAASASDRTYIVAAFRQGLADTGYVEGQNVAIEYRWAEGDYGRLSQMAAELVRQQVSLIVTPGAAAGALAAKNATTAIPIVFAVGQDPVKLGLVESLARPGGNATGVNFFTNELVAKRMGLLRELLPAAARVAVLVNPSDIISDRIVGDARAAANAAGLELVLLNASTPREIEAAFATAGAAASRCTFCRSRRVLQCSANPARRAGGTSPDSIDLFGTRLCRSRWIDDLRYESGRHVSSARFLRGPRSQRRQACGLAGRAVD